MPTHSTARAMMLLPFLAGALGHAAETETLASVQFLPGSDAGLAEAGTLRIGYQVAEASGILCFKPEHGRRLRFDEGTRGFVVTDQAQGGATVQNLDYIEVPMTVREAGDYHVWYRALFPRLGNWLHFEAMDDGEAIRSTDNPRRPELTGRWVWVKGPKYSLTAGEHVWKLDGWRGGAQLDRVLFARDPEFVPTGQGPGPTAKLRARNAHFTTGELAPGAKRWGYISWTQAGRGGVMCFVSADAREWREVRNRGDLAELARGPSLYVRFALAASPAGQSPLVQAVRIEYEPDPATWITLENDVARLVFTPRGIREIVGKQTGATYRAAGAATEFFRFKVKRPGYGPETEYRASRDAQTKRLSVRKGVLHGDYRFLDGKIVIRPTISLGADGRSRWRMQVQNGSALEVTGVRYPILRSAAVRGDGSDDVLIVNSVWGQMIRNPAKWRQRYPTTPTLRWMDLYDAAGGVYLADHHTNFDTFNDLAMYVSPSEDGSAVDLSLQKFLRVAPGSSRDLDHYVVAVHQGDWHAAADMYREEVVSRLRKPAYPEWLQWCDGWTNGHGFWPGYGFNMIQRYGELAAGEGLPFMHASRMAASSCAFGYGGFWPQPTPVGGTNDELRQYFDEIRELGCDAEFYIAWNLHSPMQCVDAPRVCAYIPRGRLSKDTPFYSTEWYERNAARPHSGEVAVVKDMRSQARMCPGARGWQQYLFDWTERYVRGLGSFIYFDCTSIGIAYGVAGICHNRAHGHDDYGVYYRETTKMLERVTERARRIDPDFACSGEGCNDITGQTGILHLASGVINRNEINRYTVPDQIVIDGSLNSGTRAKLGGIERFNVVFLNGTRFDGLPHRQHGAQAKQATTAEYGLQLLDLRRWTKQYLYPARFMDTVGIEIVDSRGRAIPNPRIDPYAADQIAPVTGPQAKWSKLETDDERVHLVNTLNTDGRGDLTLALDAARVGQIAAAWVVSLGGSPTGTTCRLADGKWRCPFPRAKLATVLIVERAAPLVRIDGPRVIVTCPDEVVNVAVRVVNVEPNPATATLRWDTPEGCASGEPVSVKLTPGEVGQVTVPLRVGPSVVKRRHNMHLLVDWRGRTYRIYQRLSVTNPIIAHLRDDDQKNPTVSLWNLSSEARKFSGELCVDAPLSPALTRLDVTLEPHERRTVTAEVRGWDDVRLPVRARLDLRCGEERIRKSLLMYPFVPNGDFERDEVGDGYPEWWAGWTPRGPQDGYKRIRLDSTRRAAGRYSLRLDPDTRDGFFAMAQPMVARLKANRTYAVSIDIYRQEATPEVYLQIEKLRLGHKGSQAGKWQRFAGRFSVADPTRFPDMNPAYDWVRWLRLISKSKRPAWFDNLAIRETGEDKAGGG